jgi:hypothetical protein
MSIEGILVGLLAIVIGAAWAFYGLKLFTILLPIWAFFFGLVTGAQWAADVFGQGFFSSVLSWGIGLVFGLTFDTTGPRIPRRMKPVPAAGAQKRPTPATTDGNGRGEEDRRVRLEDENATEEQPVREPAEPVRK